MLPERVALRAALEASIWIAERAPGDPEDPLALAHFAEYVLTARREA